MLRFFKINDPYRLIAIFLIAFAIKIPFFINDCAYFEMQHWLIIGEAMKSGHMYVDIFDSLAPLAASTYWLLVLVFGKSTLMFHILGTFLLVIQAVIFNNLTISNKVYEQNTYLPAFVYLILASSHYALSVFSPVQIGMTFILLTFSKLLSHVEFRAKRDEQIMSIGLLIGIAVLFYLPFIIFLPIVLIILLVFTNTLKRRYTNLMIAQKKFFEIPGLVQLKDESTFKATGVTVGKAILEESGFKSGDKFKIKCNKKAITLTKM